MSDIKWTALRHKMLREVADSAECGTPFVRGRTLGVSSAYYFRRDDLRPVSGPEKRALQQLLEARLFAFKATGPSYFHGRQTFLNEAAVALLAEWDAAHPEGVKR